MNPKLHKLYAITDRKKFKYSFKEQISFMLDKGIRMFQLREKDLPPDELFLLAEKIFPLLKEKKATFIINDRVDLALLVDADGVHLPSKSLPIRKIKEKFPNLIVGKSCHTLEEAKKAEEEGADYITFSPIFETPNKGKPKGLKALKEVVDTVSIPVYALGGITRENTEKVFETGAFGVAGIRLFIE